MTQQDKDLLEQNGFDVQGALHRFIMIHYISSV